MGDTTIEWTDKTWNPLTGCTKVSPGCDHCYAKTMHERFNGPGSFDTITLHPDRLNQPLGWRKPTRVFVNSMSDLFHQDVPDEYIARVFAVMALAPRHTFQVLTKRHSRLRSLLSSEGFQQSVWDHWEQFAVDRDHYATSVYEGRLPLPNVWLGVSVENQQWADIRIPALLDTPAAVRFLSCEPLLGPVDLGGFTLPGTPLSWVIVGGESGPGAQPMHPDWARSLRDQCVAAGVPFLFKQWGSVAPFGQLPDEAVADWEIKHGADYPSAAFCKVGKKAAGRLLDGRTWDEYPQAVA